MRLPFVIWLTVFFRKEDPTKSLGDKLRRIFVERGVDFFDNNQGSQLQEGILTNSQNADDTGGDAHGEEEDSEILETSNRVMTTEDLFKMRMEILPQL